MIKNQSYSQKIILMLYQKMQLKFCIINSWDINWKVLLYFFYIKSNFNDTYVV